MREDISPQDKNVHFGCRSDVGGELNMQNVVEKITPDPRRVLPAQSRALEMVSTEQCILINIIILIHSKSTNGNWIVERAMKFDKIVNSFGTGKMSHLAGYIAGWC